jgi:hypothetical protein
MRYSKRRPETRAPSRAHRPSGVAVEYGAISYLTPAPQDSSRIFQRARAAVGRVSMYRYLYYLYIYHPDRSGGGLSPRKLQEFRHNVKVCDCNSSLENDSGYAPQTEIVDASDFKFCKDGQVTVNFRSRPRLPSWCSSSALMVRQKRAQTANRSSGANLCLKSFRRKRPGDNVSGGSQNSTVGDWLTQLMGMAC